MKTAVLTLLTLLRLLLFCSVSHGHICGARGWGAVWRQGLWLQLLLRRLHHSLGLQLLQALRSHQLPMPA